MSMQAPLIHLECTDSTNKELHRLLVKGAVEDGTAILADFQTNGRGRLQRVWESAKQDSMLCTFWCELDLSPAELPGYSLLPALAVLDTLDKLGVHATCKWPNDIRLHGRKLGGILIECVPGKNGIRGAIIGIGINLRRAPILPDAPYPPISLEDDGHSTDAETLARGIQGALMRRTSLWRDGMRAPQLEEWLSRCDHLDKTAILTVDGRKREGITRGLGRQGQLLLEIDGELREVWGEEILAPAID
jgi:BirA family biotin operon repressor/biotin-[acetyl-CoA-carboxylase] ligase